MVDVSICNGTFFTGNFWEIRELHAGGWPESMWNIPQLDSVNGLWSITVMDKNNTTF